MPRRTFTVGLAALANGKVQFESFAFSNLLSCVLCKKSRKVLPDMCTYIKWGQREGLDQFLSNSLCFILVANMVYYSFPFSNREWVTALYDISIHCTDGTDQLLPYFHYYVWFMQLILIMYKETKSKYYSAPVAFVFIVKLRIFNKYLVTVSFVTFNTLHNMFIQFSILSTGKFCSIKIQSNANIIRMELGFSF